MLEQIQQLIADGSTEEALALLAQQSSDALLLQARYNAGKKQYNMGLIEFSEWQRTQAQINYAALELAKSVGRSSGSNTGQAGAGVPAIGSSGSSAIVAAPQAQPEVFISYNHEDSFAMRSVDFLKELDVTD
ncbi:MAG: hypothetical protein H6574_07120 [Lewinellaceae bacterium]|nr:hypothetical protein [Lewinellaceae bacterium]